MQQALNSISSHLIPLIRSCHDLYIFLAHLYYLEDAISLKDFLELKLFEDITRVQKTHHKFMRASYMKHFAKFLAILHHNASFFNFCFIINFGFIKNLLHILEILKYYCCLCHSATDCHCFG